MKRKCPICKKEFEGIKNKKYCSIECRNKAYKNYNYSSIESQEKYRDKIMEEEGLGDITEYNLYFREKTANNKGMTTTEYNSYLEERKARKLGISVKELRHYTYLSKKEQEPLYKYLGLTYEEYKEKLKR